MLPNGRRLGAHLPLGSGMVRAADRAAAIGASALQVFSDNPTSWRRRPTLPRELPAFLDRLAAHDIAPLAIHAPYLVNLAGPEPDFHERSVSVLANELRVAAAYGARFVNVHVGSHRGAGVEAGIDRFADGVRQTLALLDSGPALDGADGPAAPHGPAALDRPDGPDGGGPVLVLENSAGGGFGLGVTLEELARIDEAVRAAGIDPARFGFCLDTAHAWGAGYAIDTQGGVDELLAEFDRRLGLDRLRMVHLNDSRVRAGVPGGPSRAHRRGTDRGSRPRADPGPPGARPRRLLPRDPGHGGRLRRGQHRAGAGPRRGPPPRRRSRAEAFETARQPRTQRTARDRGRPARWPRVP